MARSITPPVRFMWKQVRRVQRVGFAEGMAGRGGHWYAIGIGAWGLLRLRSLSSERHQVLLSEVLSPGEQMVITHETTTRAEHAARMKQARKQGRKLQKQASAADRAAKKARKGLSRSERRQLDAQDAQARSRSRRRRRRRRDR